MNCQQFFNIIQKQLDGQLPQELAADFAEHLAECPACAENYAEAVALDALLTETLSQIDIPTDFAASVMAKLPDNMPEVAATDNIVPISMKGKGKNLLKPVIWASCAAAVAVCVGLFGFNGHNMDILPNQVQIAKEDPVHQENNPALDRVENSTVNGIENKDNNVVDEGQENTDNKTANSSMQIAQQEKSSTGLVSTPKVAYNTQINGQFNITILAQHENASALAPHIKVNGNIEYLLKTETGYELWQQSLTASDPPIMLEKDATLVTRGQNNTSVMSWLQGREYITDISEDGSLFAANIKGEEGGLWISPNNANSDPRTFTTIGGGSCLSISPDSSKIAFTDSTGKLYVAYLAENTTIEVFDGNVSYLAWLGESRTLIFSATPKDEVYSNIYRATIP
jgi:hypothetical protein